MYMRIIISHIHSGDGIVMEELVTLTEPGVSDGIVDDLRNCGV